MDEASGGYMILFLVVQFTISWIVLVWVFTASMRSEEEGRYKLSNLFSILFLLCLAQLISMLFGIPACSSFLFILLAVMEMFWLGLWRNLSMCFALKQTWIEKAVLIIIGLGVVVYLSTLTWELGEVKGDLSDYWDILPGLRQFFGSLFVLLGVLVLFAMRAKEYKSLLFAINTTLAVLGLLEVGIIYRGRPSFMSVLFTLLVFGEIFVIGVWVLCQRRQRGFTPFKKLILLTPYLLYFLFGFLMSGHAKKILTTSSGYHLTHKNMRYIRLALETYRINYDNYPPAVDQSGRRIPLRKEGIRLSSGYVPWMLTTPIQYMDVDPLATDFFAPDDASGWDRYCRYATDGKTGNIVVSRGPDGIWNIDPAVYIRDASCDVDKFLIEYGGNALVYDPTNGILSSGDVFRTGP